MPKEFFDNQMVFEIVYRSLVNNVLGPYAKNRFRLLDYPMAIEGAEGTLDELRSVSIYMDTFKVKTGSFRKPEPDIKYNLDFLVTADAKADLAVLEQNFEQNQADIYFRAIHEMQDAKTRANALMDELFRIIYQIVMNPLNDKLGLDRMNPNPGIKMGDRDITDYHKGVVYSRGNKIMLEAQAVLACNFEEYIFGGEQPLSEEGAGDTIGAAFELSADFMP